jgi:hypothetical protein
VRQGDWKLIWRTPLPSQIELFNIAQDPYEKTNLADQNPQMVAQLQKRIEEFAAALGAPPTVRPHCPTKMRFSTNMTKGGEMSVSGHSRPGRTGSKSGHVRYAAESGSRPEL